MIRDNQYDLLEERRRALPHNAAVGDEIGVLLLQLGRALGPYHGLKCYSRFGEVSDSSLCRMADTYQRHVKSPERVRPQS